MKLLRMCPDCGEVLQFNSQQNAFMHGRETNCAYMENIKGERIWDDKMRDARLKEIAQTAEDDDQLSFF